MWSSILSSFFSWNFSWLLPFVVISKTSSDFPWFQYSLIKHLYWKYHLGSVKWSFRLVNVKRGETSKTYLLLLVSPRFTLTSLKDHFTLPRWYFGVITSTDSVGGEFTQDYNNHKVKNNESLSGKLNGHKMFFFILE